MIFYFFNFCRDLYATLEWISFSALSETLRIFPLMRRVRKHTKVRIPRLKTLYRLTKNLDRIGVPGDLVEFGVWRGGSAAVLARASRRSPFERKILLFDSFEGNAPPTKDDGADVRVRYHAGWNKAGISQVKNLFEKLSIPESRYHIVKGWYEDTLPHFLFPAIALIHFDADMREAAKLFLEYCYDALQPGGYIVFNSWEVREGVRQVFAEFMRKRTINLTPIRIDGVACYIQKPLETRSIQRAHYEGLQHDTKRRFISYWHQIDEAIALKPRRMLEVGIGNGFVSRYLKRLGINLTTCDNNGALRPDCVASVTHMPFSDNAFDVVMACEILEHMPYEESLSALRELHRVSAQAVIISLPDATRAFRIEIPVPKWGKIKKLIVRPTRNPPAHIVERQEGHHWEIGKKDYPLARIIADIKKAGFILERTYRVFENPYHRFFILKKL